MFPSKVCQLLCNLHAISIEMPSGPEVAQSEKPNMSVDRITAHIQCRDKCIHWRDSIIGQGTLYLVLPEDGLYNLHIHFIWSCTVEPGFCELVTHKKTTKTGESPIYKSYQLFDQMNRKPSSDIRFMTLDS